MSNLEANLDLLAGRQPALALHLRGIALDRVEVFASKAGIPTARCNGSRSSSLLHSLYDPMREARNLIRKTDVGEADYIVLLGFGLGYTLDALMETNADPARHYFVVESDMAVLKAAFESRDLSAALTAPHLHFAWPAAGPELAKQWQDFFDPVGAQKCVFVAHPPIVALDPAHFRSAAEMIQSETFRIFTDINTLVGRSQAFLDNFVQNLPRAVCAPGVADYAGLFSGMPAVLVSAGPSLDKNIHELRTFEDHVLILSTDTALKPLLAAGVEPHFVLTGDPSYENYLHLRDNRTTRAVLVAEATAYPQSLVEFGSRLIACIFENSSLRALSQLLGSKGTLRAWGSVATMALDFALVLGCNPVILIGQDLAHSDGRTYCSGLHFEQQWFEGVHSPEEWQARWKKLAEGKRTLSMQDILDRPVETTDKLSAYWNWIQKEIHNHPEVKFINATEGGILKGGTEIMSLREALYRHCTKSRSLRSLASERFYEMTRNISSRRSIDLRVFRRESSELARVVQQGIRICEDARRSDARRLFRQLEMVKEDIYAYRHVAPIVDSFNQIGNVTFLRKRAGLTRSLDDLSGATDIRTTYLEYFMTVQQSLRKIEVALVRISEALDPGSQGRADTTLA